ncbi:alpha/beta fold hydrolase [Zunongwangia sp.]|uniref:alpha/beta fold hydrolase n=1 Tax=Zunongwangia sp. TaxID=1965325 RepID=UPI003AA90F24
MAKTVKNKKPIQQILLPWYILYGGKVLNYISPRLATKFAGKLYLTPFKGKMPKRELYMDKHSEQEWLILPNSGKKIRVYKFGNPENPKVLLVHGWSGRGTQLSKIAETLVDKGFSIISFDAPGHGKTPGKTSMMPYFVESIQALYKKFGVFNTIIGHSLGGMSTLKAVKEGVKTKKIVIIGAADKISDLTIEFVSNLNMDEKVAHLLKAEFDEKFGTDVNNFSSSVSAKKVDCPCLIIHDKDDVDVPVSCAFNIQKELKNSEIFITKHLGHRKILGDKKVINKIATFMTA